MLKQYIYTYFFRTIADLVKSLEKAVHQSSQFDLIVRRSHVLSDALLQMDKASFDPRKKLSVRTCHVLAICACKCGICLCSTIG